MADLSCLWRGFYYLPTDHQPCHLPLLSIQHHVVPSSSAMLPVPMQTYLHEQNKHQPGPASRSWFRSPGQTGLDQGIPWRRWLVRKALLDRYPEVIHSPGRHSIGVGLYEHLFNYRGEYSTHFSGGREGYTTCAGVVYLR